VLNSNSLKLQAPNSLDIKKFEIGAPSRPMSKKKSYRQKGGYFADTAVRVRALRRASQWPDRPMFSKNIGISEGTRANIENGLPLSNLTIDLILRKLPWISSDWLRAGREDGLSTTVVQRLAPLLAEESDTTRPRSRSKRDKSGR
jgi:hypothetical protein